MALVERSPDLYLDEIQVELEMQYGIRAHLSTVWRTLKALDIRNKKVRDFR
jgi:transposase